LFLKQLILNGHMSIQSKGTEPRLKLNNPL
jgi:hypothetical protein